MFLNMSRIRIIFTLSVLSLTAIRNGETTAVREVSHEDIRDAILSLVHLFRDNSDKLERHEYRERQLGEQLKKAFSTVEKKQKTEESNMNTIIDLINSINRRLDTIENIVLKGNNSNDSKTAGNIEEIINSKLANVERAIQNNQAASSVVTADPKLDSIIQNIKQMQSSIASVEQKLSIASDESGDSGAAQSATTSEIQSQLAQHREAISNIFELQKNISMQISDLGAVFANSKSSVTTDDIQQLINSTANSLQEIKYDLTSSNEKGIAKLQTEISKSQQILSEEQVNTLTVITNSFATVEALNTNIQKSYEQVLREMKGLSKIEQVLIQTADNVLDAKRRIEYGNHQILLEVGDLVKQQAKELNVTVNKRFDGISVDILNSQNGALTNLSSKIETEISQVWRQIGVMYQTLTNSADALDKLQHQTENYVNGSLTTMDSMEGKVGLITGRMSEVDDNLNYLLGRLSLVTQEFNQIKTGLGEALDNIRSSFHTVQDKVNDTGPGPNPIVDEIAPNDELKKTKYSVN